MSEEATRPEACSSCLHRNPWWQTALNTASPPGKTNEQSRDVVNGTAEQLSRGCRNERAWSTPHLLGLQPSPVLAFAFLRPLEDTPSAKTDAREDTPSAKTDAQKQQAQRVELGVRSTLTRGSTSCRWHAAVYLPPLRSRLVFV